MKRFPLLIVASLLTASCAALFTGGYRSYPVPQEVMDKLGGTIRPLRRLPLIMDRGEPVYDIARYLSQFQTDGITQVIGRGQFRLGPETIFCVRDHSVDESIRRNWQDENNYERFSQYVYDSITHYIGSVRYRGRRSDVAYDDENVRNPPSSDHQTCLASNDKIIVDSAIMQGRLPNSIAFSITYTQDETLYRFFMEREVPIEATRNNMQNTPFVPDGPYHSVNNDSKILTQLSAVYVRIWSHD
jgi:hypothetical protein